MGQFGTVGKTDRHVSRLQSIHILADKYHSVNNLAFCIWARSQFPSSGDNINIFIYIDCLTSYLEISWDQQEPNAALAEKATDWSSMETFLGKNSVTNARSFIQVKNWAGGQSEITRNAGGTHTRAPTSPPLPTPKKEAKHIHTHTRAHTQHPRCLRCWITLETSPVQRLDSRLCLRSQIQCAQLWNWAWEGISQRWFIMHIKSDPLRTRSGLHGGEEATEQPQPAATGWEGAGARKTHLAGRCAPLRQTTALQRHCEPPWFVLERQHKYEKKLISKEYIW